MGHWLAVVRYMLIDVLSDGVRYLMGMNVVIFPCPGGPLAMTHDGFQTSFASVYVAFKIQKKSKIVKYNEIFKTGKIE